TSNRKSENIVVNNCILSSHCNAIKCGTESSGGFKNIVISNCIIRPSEQRTTIYGFPDGISGITLGMVDGGVLDGININNIIIDGPRVPLFLRLGNRARPYRADQGEIPVGSYKNVNISNITARGADTTGCSISGIPGHPVENISLSNIRISFKGGRRDKNYSMLVPELETHYPESTMFGSLPASAFYIRHAKNIDLDQIHLYYDNPDTRAALVCDDVENLRLQRTSVCSNSQPDYLFRLINCTNATVSECANNSVMDALVRLDGAGSEGVRVYNNHGKFASEMALGEDVDKNAVQGKEK
ncbi:MAG: hypothetical protein ACK5HT_00675, partial [Draconibacterium sp.]